VARLVILNTGVGAGRAPSEEWLRFRAFVRKVGVDLVPGQLIRISCVTELDDEVVDAYNAPFPTPESKAGVLAFPELVPTELDHPSAAKMLEVRAALEHWERPALVLFSDSDPIFSTVAAEDMASRIPGAGPAEIIAGAGHFLQEYEEIASESSASSRIIGALRHPRLRAIFRPTRDARTAPHQQRTAPHHQPPPVSPEEAGGEVPARPSRGPSCSPARSS
jgi:pimeloyl-ACP methyl ester carboxylesterase